MNAAILLTALVLNAAGEQGSKLSALQSGKWEIYTDSGEKAGAAILSKLLEMESAYGTLAYPVPDSAPPIRVLLFHSNREYEPLRRGETNTGVFQSAPERDYIFLLDTGDETQRAARHEYVHLALHHSTGPLPRWLEEGLAEYFSTLQMKGGNVTVGKPVPAHVQLLNSMAWLEPQALASVVHDEEFGGDTRKVTLFYAQSWGLVHQLMSAPDAQQRLDRYVAALRDGSSQDEAFERAFSMDMKAALAAARTAISSGRLPVRELPAAAAAKPPEIARRSLQPQEWRLSQAEALDLSGQLSAAEAIYKDLQRSRPDDPATLAALGFMALRRSDYTTAKAHLMRAMQLGDNSAATAFEYAMLLRETHAPEAEVVANLRKAVARNPSFAEAWYYLGSAALRDGRADEAAESFRRAAAILPRQSTFWESLGRAYLLAGRKEDARDAARHALETAATPQQKSLAQSLTAEITAPPKAAQSAAPAPQGPAGWQAPKGDASVEGRLVFVDCATSTLKFHIETQPAKGKQAAKRTILTATNPNEIFLSGKTGERREFVCGAQKNAPLVTAGFRAATTPGQKTAGTLVTLEFK